MHYRHEHAFFLEIFKAKRGVRIMYQCALCNPNDSNHLYLQVWIVPVVAVRWIVVCVCVTE